MTASLWLGVMGPVALGYQTQLLVHKIMGFEKPKGWGEQLPNYPVINYNIYYERNLLDGDHAVKLNGLAYLQLGSLLNTATAGLNFMISNKKDNNFPDRYYITTTNEKFGRLKFFIQLKPMVRFTATNAILEGGLFQAKNYYHIPSSNLERFNLILEGNMGIHAKRVSLVCKQTLETPQFKTVHGHTYGSVILGINF